MAGLYDAIKAENSSYVPQFVGSTYEDLNKASAVLDKRYRENKDYADKLAIMAANEQYLDNDKAIKDKVTQSLYGSIDKIASSDQNFENSTAAVSQLAKDYLGNQERIAALKNYSLAQKEREMEMQGYDLNFGDSRDKFTTIDPETQQIRNFNLNRQKRGDYSQRMQGLLGKVADDGYTTGPTGEKIEFDNYERYLIKSGQVNLLAKDKLNRLIENLLPAYKASSEGAQDIRRLKEIEGISSDPITVPIFDKKGKQISTRQTTGVDEDIRQRFRSLGAPQAFTKTAMRWDDFGIPVQDQRANTGTAYTGNNPGSVTDNSSLKPVHLMEDGDEYTEKEGGEYVQYINKQTGQPLKRESNPLYSSVTDEGTGSDIQYLRENYDRVVINAATAEKELNDNYTKASNYFPDSYKDYNEYKESYKSAVKNHAKVTPNGNAILGDMAERYDNYINRSVATSPLYFKGGSDMVKGLEGLAEKIGTSPSNIKLKAINTFYDSPKADLPGGYIEAKIEVDDSKVKNHPTSVFIPLNDQFTALAQPIDHLYKNSFYAGRDVYTEDNPYIPSIGGEPMRNKRGEVLTFHTVTVPIPKAQQKEGQPGFKTLVFPGKITPNGSGGQDLMWDENPMTIGQWKQFMVGALSPLFKNALNTGQTFNAKDVKDAGIEW